MCQNMLKVSVIGSSSFITLEMKGQLWDTVSENAAAHSAEWYLV